MLVLNSLYSVNCLDQAVEVFGMGRIRVCIAVGLRHEGLFSVTVYTPFTSIIVRYSGLVILILFLKGAY